MSPSCAAIRAANTNAGNGVYRIDPDDSGPIAPVDLYCDMSGGTWTLVGNFFDSVEDDMPNDTSYVESGWQQLGSGSFASIPTRVAQAVGTGVSGAVSLAFVAAIKASAFQANLKMCMISAVGTDTGCRESPTSLTLVSYSAGNPRLSAYSSNPLVYTFGRLAGLAGSRDDYDYPKYTSYTNYIPITAGSFQEFGAEARIAEYYSGPATCSCGWGVWQAYGAGLSFQPNRANECELLTCSTSDCSTGGTVEVCNSTVAGFRLYVGP